MTEQQFAIFDTPIGRCGIVWGERGMAASASELSLDVDADQRKGGGGSARVAFELEIPEPRGLAFTGSALRASQAISARLPRMRFMRCTSIRRAPRGLLVSSRTMLCSRALRSSPSIMWATPIHVCQPARRGSRGLSRNAWSK